jgi:hypothetical protein
MFAFCCKYQLLGTIRQAIRVALPLQNLCNVFATPAKTRLRDTLAGIDCVNEQKLLFLRTN